MNTVKTCRRCSEEKPLEQFYKRKNNKYDCYCVPCKKIVLAEYYERKMGKKTEKKKLDSLTEEQINTIIEQRKLSIPLKKIAENTGISKGNLYNWRHQGLFDTIDKDKK